MGDITMESAHLGGALASLQRDPNMVFKPVKSSADNGKKEAEPACHRAGEEREEWWVWGVNRQDSPVMRGQQSI